MRPRGRGDDVDDDDDDDEYEDITPPRSMPEPDADPAPAPAAEPAPSPSASPALAPPQQPARAPLSSLVVRPPPQENGGGGSSPPSPAPRAARSPSPAEGGFRRGASPPRRRRDFSPPPGPRGWERRRSPPPPPPHERRRPGSPPPPVRRRFSPPPRFQPPRHPRFHDEQRGYGMHGGPSPPRPRRYEASSFDDSVGSRYSHGYQGGGRGGPRFREGSPPSYGRGGRSYGRGYTGPGKEFIKIDGEYVHRNDPNLSPREGDWICQNPNCGNLNFARRTHCNNCNKYRYAAHEAYEPSRSPRRGYHSPPPRGPPRMLGPPVDRAPPREVARYRSPPPHGWGGGDPRGYAARSPPERAGRFTDPSPKERMGFRGERDPRDRAKIEWSATDEYGQRERPHDGLYLGRSRRRSGSPRGNWGNDLRDRSRSPRNRPMKTSFTGGGRTEDYADPYVSRGRPNNLEAGHGRGRGRGRGYRPGGGPYPGEGRADRRGAPRGRSEDGY